MKLHIRKIILNPLILVICTTLLSLQSYSQVSDATFFDQSNEFFSKYVDVNGMVGYTDIKENPSLLNQLYDQIGKHEVSDKSADYLKAFYTNAYNILVIKQVVERYPIDGPLTVNGFFDKIQHNVAGEELTLNQVEKDKNLYVNKDERLHFALVCAAISCPPLANFAFYPDKINEQLEARTILALNHPEFIRSTKKGAELSQIFNWYQDDFKDSAGSGVIEYINNFRKKQIPIDQKIVYYEYNWLLNKK